MQSQAQSLAQSLAELCLRYPEPIGIHPSISPDQAMSLLVQAVRMSMQVPYKWGHIDQPAEGSTFLIFMVPQQQMFPNDGIRYQDQEQRYSIPIGSMGSGPELEVCEIKYGFIPDSQDTAAFRVRRRYRLSRGGHPQLVLVHYSRGPQISIIPALLGQPIRSYPLRTINEPAMYVLGDKAGQKVYPNTPGAPSHPGPSMAGGSGLMGMTHLQTLGVTHNPRAMVEARNREMEAWERRQQEIRPVHTNTNAQQAQFRYDEDDSGDELDQISTRTLALARYSRNHNYMNEVFMYAAFAEKNPPPLPDAYRSFNATDIDSKIAKLQEEIDGLQRKAAARKEELARLEPEAHDGEAEAGDISMQSLPEGILV